MPQRTLDMEENKELLSDIENLEPVLQLELIDAILAEKIKTTADVRKWLAAEFVNADKITVCHGIVDRTRNRLNSIGRKGQEFPIDRSRIEAGVIATQKRREQREERNRQTEQLKQEAAQELGAEFAAAYPQFINLLIGGTFSDVPGYGMELSIMAANAKRSFLETHKGKGKVFDKYLLKIMATALEKYRNKTLSVSNTFLYMNAMMQVIRKGSISEGRKLGKELTTIATDRGEMDIISGLELVWMSCIATIEPDGSPDDLETA